MVCKGVVRGNVIKLEGDVALPDGTRVSVVPEQAVTVVSLKEWLQEARRLRAQLPRTSNSVDILRHVREKRASR